MLVARTSLIRCVTRASTAAALYAASETAAKRPRKRAVRSAVFAWVFFGPVCGAYYPACERLLGSSAVRKVVFDQIAWSPIWHTAYCLSHKPDDVRTSVRDGVRYAIAGWPVWTTVHIATYSVVPVATRAAWVLLCDAAWICLVSSHDRKERETKN